MDISAIPFEIILSQGFFAVLFVWLFHDTRQESKKREERLVQQIEKQNIAQDKIVQSLERMEVQIANLKEEVR